MMKRCLILGFGVSGRASAAFLKAHGVPVVAVDRKPLGDVLPDREDFPLDDISMVVLSPGIPVTHPIAARAVSLGIEVVGETELAFRFLKNRAVGVTGTNGKTTVTLLIEHVLNRSGRKARAVGNIGTALSDYLLHPDLEEILVIELSSFQLETLKEKKLDVSVYLNLTPDHLDRYGSMREYAAAKAKIERCSNRLFISRQVAKEYGDLFQRIELFDEEETNGEPDARSGMPERQNVLAAKAICLHLGVSEQEFDAALADFRKPHHRVEWVADVRGVRYFNDSKGTNIDAVMHAMKLFRGPVVLIAGGVDKGASYRPWIEAFAGKVKKIVAYGEAAPKIEEDLRDFFSLERVERFPDAFQTAQREAEEGDTVLLSPGCSSFDQFKNYEHRGDEFRNLVQSLEKELK